MANALNPYMQGRQMGMNRPYAQINSGGKVGVDQLMAARQANAINPTVTQGRNVQMVNIDPAKDIRASADANRLDLRARMNNDAAMDMERFRQQTMDERALFNNQFTAEQNELNRELQKRQLDATLENNRLLQDSKQTFQGKESQKQREFLASESDKKIGADMEALGMRNDFAMKLAEFEGGIRTAINDKQLSTQVSLAEKEIALKEKEIQSRITMLEKELSVKVSEGDKNRKADKELQDARIASGEKEGAANRKTQTDINTANNQNRLAVGKQSQLASLNELKENLAFKRQELKAMQDMKQAELDDKYAQSQAFGATVARANENWQKWETQGKADYRKQKENAYMNKYGMQAIQAIQGGGDGSIQTQSGVLQPTIQDRNGNEVMNPQWVERARSMILMDATQRSVYSAEVDRAVEQRDQANYRIWEAYQTTSAKAGIPTQSTTPLTPGNSGINPNKVY